MTLFWILGFFSVGLVVMAPAFGFLIMFLGQANHWPDSYIGFGTAGFVFFPLVMSVLAGILCGCGVLPGTRRTKRKEGTPASPAADDAPRRADDI
jgi:hypothetical protein